MSSKRSQILYNCVLTSFQLVNRVPKSRLSCRDHAFVDGFPDRSRFNHIAILVEDIEKCAFEAQTRLMQACFESTLLKRIAVFRAGVIRGFLL